MNDEKREKYRGFIAQQIAAVRAQLGESSSIEAPIKPDAAIGRLSRVDAMQQQQMQMAIRRRREEQLERLESALLLVEQGKYGVCNMCGEDIPEARLEIVPDTQMCAPCLTEIQSR